MGDHVDVCAESVSFQLGLGNELPLRINVFGQGRGATQARKQDGTSFIRIVSDRISVTPCANSMSPTTPFPVEAGSPITRKVSRLFMSFANPESRLSTS